MDKKELGVLLAAKRGVSKNQLSKLSGLSRTQINNIEQGKSSYTVDSLLLYIKYGWGDFMLIKK